MFEIGIDRYLIRLRFTRMARFHFNHGGALMGLMCRAMRTHNLPAGFIPFACESGRVRFHKGDMYHIGLTLAGAAGREFNLERFRSELSSVGAQNTTHDTPRATLAGNFEVVSVEHLPPLNVCEDLANLKAAPQLTIKFLSPFRLKRPPALKEERAGYLSRNCFPPEHFIDRLIKRLFLLAHGRYPEREECNEIALCLGAGKQVIADSRSLLWLDVPLEGAPGKHEHHPKGYTLGGVLGQVALRDVPDTWIEALALGQYVHAGENTHFGLGRYVIKESRTESGDRFRPARTLTEELHNPALLEDSLRRVARHSLARGVDGIAPGDYLRVPDMLAAQVATELKYGTYRPSPLLGIAAIDGSELPTSNVPTARDRMVQRAACIVLGQTVEKLLEDSSYVYRKGFSRTGAAHSFKRAYEEGYRHIADTSLDPLFEAVEWERLFANLDALFPYEPLVQVLRGWVTAPVVFKDTLLERERGLPLGTSISSLLVKLYLDEFDEQLLGLKYRLVWYGRGFILLSKNVNEACKATKETGGEHINATPEPVISETIRHPATKQPTEDISSGGIYQ